MPTLKKPKKNILAQIGEKDVQKVILEYLTLKRIFHYRNNSGVMTSEYKGKRSFVRFGAVGSPDIICVIKGQYVGIEVKGPKGVQSDNQKDFQKQLELAGGRYILARDLNDIINTI